MSPSFKRLKSPSFWKAAGVGALAFMAAAFTPLASAQDATGDLESPGAILQGALSGVVPRPTSLFDQYMKPGMVNITGIGIKIETPTRIRITANTTLDNPFGIGMPLGNVGLNVLLDDQPLATLTAFNLTLGPGIAPFNVTGVVDLADGKLNPGLKTSMTNLVNSLVGGTTPAGPPPKLVIDNITFDGNAIGLDPVVIPTQLPPKPPIAPPTDVNQIGAISTPQPPPVVGLTGLIDPTVNLTLPKLTKVTFIAQTGASLKLGVGFDWNNPFNLEADIPAISVDIGLNSTRLVTVRLEQIHLRPGNMSAETNVILSFNNDPLAAIQTAAFLNDFMAGMLTQTLNIGNLTFGGLNSTNMTEFNDILSGIKFDLPLYGLSTVALKEFVMTYVNQYLPIDISQLGGSPSSIMSYIKGLAVKTSPGHTLLIQPQIQIPLGFGLDVNVPYFAMDLYLGSSRLAKLFIANLLGTGSGTVDISLGLGLIFDEPNPDMPATVASVVNGLLSGSPIDVRAGFGNLAIGVSPADAVNTLNNINIGAPISSVIKGGISTGDVLGDIMSQTNVTIGQNAIAIDIGTLASLTIHEANIAILPDNHIAAGITLDMFLGLPIVADIGYFGINLSLDGSQLAGVSLNSRFAYNGGTASMVAGLDISVGTGDEIATKVATLVNAIIAKQSISSSIGINGLVLGDSPSDTISALSQISVNLPLGGLLNGPAPSLPGDFLSDLIAQLGLKLSGLSLATVPNAGLRVGATAVFSNPIPVTLTVPYLGVAGGLDSVDIANVGVNNLNLVTGGNTLEASVDLNFNNADDAKNKVATFVGRIAEGQLGQTPEALTVHNLRLGASPTDYFDLLSKVSISIPSATIFNRANVDYITGLLGLNLTQIGGGLLNSVQISQLSADLSQPPVIALGTSVAVSGINLQADVSIGYFGIDLALDSTSLARVDVPQITIQTANNQLSLTVQASVAISDTPQLAEVVGKLFNFFMSADNTVPVNSLVISKPLLGVSPADHIQTFSLISYPLGLPSILTQAKTYLNGIISGGNSTDLFSRIGLSNLVIDLNAPQVIGIDAGVLIKSLSLPAQIKLNYIGVDIGIDATTLAEVSIPKLDIGSNGADLTIGTHIDATVATSDAAQTAVAGLVNAVIAGQVPQGNIVVSNLAVGGSKDNTFKFLQGIKLALPLSKIFAQIPAGTPSNPTDLINRIGLNNLVIDLNAPQVIGIDAGVVIKSLSLPAQIKLNYVGVDIGVDSVNLAQVSIPKLELGSNGADLTIATHVDATVSSSEDAQGLVAGLVNAVLAGQVPQGNIMVTNLAVGASKDNVFKLFQGIKLSVPLSQIFAQVPAGTPSNPTDLINRIGLSDLVIDLNAPQVIGIDAGVVIKSLSLPAQIKLNYVGVDIGVDSVNLAQVSVPKLQLGSNGADLTIATSIAATVASSDAAQTAVAALVDAVIAGQVPQGNIMVTNLAVGASKDNVFKLFQGIKLSVPLSQIFGLIPPGTNPGSGSSLLDKLILDSANINMRNPPKIGADLAVALQGFSFDAKILLNYVSVSAALDSTPLATVNVPSIALSSGNNQVAVKVQTLIGLEESDEIQDKVAALVNAIIGGTAAPSANLVVGNIAFGGSAGNVFHILDKVRVTVPLGPYIKMIQDMIGGTTPGGAPAFSITQLDLSAPGANELAAAVGVSLGGMASKISVDMPYIGLSVNANGQNLVSPAVNNLQLSNGKVSLSASLPFGSAAPQIIGSLSTPVSQLLFTSVGNVPGSIVASGIQFGASPSQAYKIAGKVAVTIQLNDVFQKAQAYINANNPLRINDMDTALTPTGIQASIKMPGVALGLPLKMNFGSEGIQLEAFHEGSGSIMTIKAGSVSLISTPWNLGAYITPTEPAFSKALEKILPNALQWKNVLEGVTLGGVRLGACTTMSQLTITPPVVTLWEPINMPLDKLKPKLSPFGADFLVNFINRGPLQVDLGFIDVMVKSNGIDTIQVTNIGSAVHLNNGNQNGGVNDLNLNAAFKFSFWQLLPVLVGLLNPSKALTFDFNMRTPSGASIDWLNNALKNAPQGLWGELLPILIKALTKIKFF